MVVEVDDRSLEEVVGSGSCTSALSAPVGSKGLEGVAACVASAEHRAEDTIDRELSRAQVEVGTAVCSNVEELLRSLDLVAATDGCRRLEFRVADVPMTVDESVVLAGLCRALVVEAEGMADPPPVPRPEIVRAALWRAARFGLAGELRRLLEGGTGADRQRKAYARLGRITDVVAELARATVP